MASAINTGFCRQQGCFHERDLRERGRCHGCSCCHGYIRVVMKAAVAVTGF